MSKKPEPKTDLSKRSTITKSYEETRDIMFQLDVEVKKVDAAQNRAAARRGRKLLQQIINNCKQLRKDLVEATKKK